MLLNNIFLLLRVSWYLLASYFTFIMRELLSHFRIFLWGWPSLQPVMSVMHIRPGRLPSLNCFHLCHSLRSPHHQVQVKPYFQLKQYLVLFKKSAPKITVIFKCFQSLFGKIIVSQTKIKKKLKSTLCLACEWTGCGEFWSEEELFSLFRVAASLQADFAAWCQLQHFSGLMLSMLKASGGWRCE